MWGINMSFRHGIWLFVLIFEICWGGTFTREKRSPKAQKDFEIYMLKGQLYEIQELKLAQEVAKKRSGVFIGALLAQTSLQIAGTKVDSLPLFYGVRAGYQKYIGSDVGGVRVYGEYLGGVNKSVLQANQSSSYQMASANVDLIMDKSIDAKRKYAVGVFGGLGVGWNGYKDYPSATHNPNGFGLVVNLGVALTLDHRHRLELALKMPPLKSSHAFAYAFASGNIYYISYNFLL